MDEGTRAVEADPEVPVSLPKRHCEVRITKAANGFIVRVGCAAFVANNWEYVSNALREYWTDPAAAQRKYFPEPPPGRRLG